MSSTAPAAVAARASLVKETPVGEQSVARDTDANLSKVVRLADLMRPPSSGFLELCGVAGVGKTQILLDACCRAALSSESRVVFIDTEGSFSAQRFSEIVTSSTSNPHIAATVLERVQVYRTFDALELQMLICNLLDELHGCRGALRFNALFVDSIAFPFRSDFRRLTTCLGRHAQNAGRSDTSGPRGSLDIRQQRETFACAVGERSNSWKRRSASLQDIATNLRLIASRGVTVMLSNHVVQSVEAGIRPALGQQWISKAARRLLVEPVGDDGMRKAVLLASASDRLVDGSSATFSICKAGVQGEDEASGDEGSEEEACLDNDTFVGETCEAAHSDSDNESEPMVDDSQSERLADDLQASVNEPSHSWPPSWWISRVAPVTKSAAQLIKRQQSCRPSPFATSTVLQLLVGSSGCKHLQGIVEVCGAAGTGKTQVCFHTMCLALMAAKPKGNRAQPSFKPPCVIYLYSEGLAVERMEQIYAAHCQDRVLAAATTVSEMMDYTFVAQTDTPLKLYEALCTKVRLLLQYASVQLIVIDSIAALFADVEIDLGERSVQLFRLAALLQRISADYGIPILVTNQVRADFDAASRDAIKPALGHGWAACVTHRISLRRHDSCDAASGNRRSARVDFSPLTSQVEAGYTIGEMGIG